MAAAGNDPREGRYRIVYRDGVPVRIPATDSDPVTPPPSLRTAASQRARKFAGDAKKRVGRGKTQEQVEQHHARISGLRDDSTRHETLLEAHHTALFDDKEDTGLVRAHQKIEELGIDQAALAQAFKEAQEGGRKSFIQALRRHHVDDSMIRYVLDIIDNEANLDDLSDSDLFANLFSSFRSVKLTVQDLAMSRVGHGNALYDLDVRVAQTETLHRRIIDAFRTKIWPLVVGALGGVFVGAILSAQNFDQTVRGVPVHSWLSEWWACALIGFGVAAAIAGILDWLTSSNEWLSIRTQQRSYRRHAWSNDLRVQFLGPNYDNTPDVLPATGHHDDAPTRPVPVQR